METDADTSVLFLTVCIPYLLSVMLTKCSFHLVNQRTKRQFISSSYCPFLEKFIVFVKNCIAYAYREFSVRQFF